MKRNRARRVGLTLLELIMATAMLTTVMASIVVLLRTSYAAWNAHEQDLDRTESAYAVVRHIVRYVRQAEAVSVISAPGDNSGALSLLMPTGDTFVWDHNGAADRVTFGITTAADPLAEMIEELSFVGYEADGVTQTTDVGDMQAVECRVKVTLPHGAGEDRFVSCRGWIRTW